MLMHKRFYNDRTVILIFYTVIIGTQKRSSLMGKLIITSKAGARTLVGLGGLSVQKYVPRATSILAGLLELTPSLDPPMMIP